MRPGAISSAIGLRERFPARLKWGRPTDPLPNLVRTDAVRGTVVLAGRASSRRRARAARLDEPRLLARDSTRGYVNHPGAAMFAEPEAVPEEAQQGFSDDARQTWSVVKAEELARKASRSRCGRLKNVDMAARDKGVDIHRHLVAIEREIGLAEKRVWPT